MVDTFWVIICDQEKKKKEKTTRLLYYPSPFPKHTFTHIFLCELSKKATTRQASHPHLRVKEPGRHREAKDSPTAHRYELEAGTEPCLSLSLGRECGAPWTSTSTSSKRACLQQSQGWGSLDHDKNYPRGHHSKHWRRLFIFYIF